jgi:murein endopeptidase
LILSFVLAGCVGQSSTPMLVSFSPAPIIAAPVRHEPLIIVETESPPPVETSTLTAETSSAAIDELAEALLEEEDDPSLEQDALRVSSSTATGLRYTLDVSETDLQDRWKNAPAALGSISIGFADEGRIINAMQCPAGDGTQYTVVTPSKAFATAETIEYVLTAIRRVVELHPHAPPLRINNMSGPDGGYLRPHRSHQTGRDVDLAFYYPGTADPIRMRAREKAIDPALNWELIKSLVLLTDVEVIWVDYRVQKVIYDYALSIGEHRDWLDSLFNAGPKSLIKHARRHRDHFHVRFYNARAQELGRRVAPLLAERPEQNMMMHRVRSGDTLGAIALKYGSSISAIQKANRMRGTFLRIAQVLRVPLRGPCTKCPVPGAVVVPPRRLPPPELQLTSTASVALN